MKFQVDFNHNFKEDYKVLEQLGCILDDSIDENYFYWKDVDSLEELKDLNLLVRELTNNEDYYLLVNFDKTGLPWIFFENKY